MWIYDLRTNMHFTLKEKSLKREDLEDFISAYSAEQLSKRKESEQFKSYAYDELLKRDKMDLNILWLKDDSLEDSNDLPEPKIVALEIMEDLQNALDQFSLITSDLRV